MNKYVVFTLAVSAASYTNAFTPAFVGRNRHATAYSLQNPSTFLMSSPSAVDEVVTENASLPHAFDDAQQDATSQEPPLESTTLEEEYDIRKFVAVTADDILNDPSLRMMSSELGLLDLRGIADPRKKSLSKNAHSQDGIFAPTVILAKKVLGDEELNKVRAKAISLHSDVIASFVSKAETPAGKTVMKALFNVADKNHNGKVEEEELAEALRTLGFEWLKEKQIHGIFERADADHDGYINQDEWIKEAPKTLRTNLIKLAKTNGGRLGFLA